LSAGFSEIPYADTPTDNFKTLKELNQSSSQARTYNFSSGEYAVFSSNLGTTATGVLNLNGYSSSDPNIINLNSYSGFTLSKTKTTLNLNNLLFTGGYSTVGSVIYNTTNDAVINITNSIFQSNNSTSQNSALGGAIYARGKLTLTNTSFIGNSAISASSSGTSRGGAIYALNSLDMKADNAQVEISGNYTQSGTTQTNNAIYMNSSASTLTLSATNSGTFDIYDSISGANGYKLVLTGDGTGSVNLLGSVTNAVVTTSNIDISFANGTISNFRTNNLTIGENTNFIIDADLANSIADTITATNVSGTVNISGLNIISTPTQQTVTLKVLENCGNTSLNIDKLLANIENDVKSTMYNDTTLASSIRLGTTSTENDSIVISGLKDTLYEMVNDSNPANMVKNFIFRTNTTYTLSQDLPESSQESVLSIYNTSSSEFGILDANNHSLFKLTNPISTVSIKDIEIENAYSSESGSVAYLDSNTSSFSAENSLITGNTSDKDGGAIYVNDGTLSLKNTTVSQNSSNGDGGALHLSENSNVEIVNTDFTSNSSKGNGGAIYTTGKTTITADNGVSTFKGNTSNGVSNAIYVASNDGSVTLNAKNNGTIKMNDKIDGVSTGYDLNITGDSTGNVNLSESVSNANVNMINSTLNLSSDNLLSGNNFNAQGGSLNLANGAIGSTNFNTLSVNGKMSLSVDADLANVTMDRLTATNYNNNGGTINISKIQLLSDSKDNTTKILFADEPIRNAITNSVKTVTYSKIYKYRVSYNSEDGYITFNRGGSGGGGGNSGGGGAGNLSDYNPVITTSGISQHVTSLNQLQNYQTAMYHSDTYMMLPRRTRLAIEKANETAIRDYTPSFIEEGLPIQEEMSSIWVRPYASFEEVPIKHGPKMTAVNYGTIFGGESKLKKLRHGFKGVFGGYVGYNGNSVSYENIDSNQQGAVIGLTSYLYKGNFFNTLTANVGFMINENSSIYGTDSMNIITSGLADKFGYNIESRTGKYILQPSLLLGYTYVGASDYTTANDVRISTDALNVFHFAPALKFITNMENGWQPYVTVMLMCNFSDSSNITADNVRLPSISIDPYVEYGFGIQRRWNDKFSGYAQATVRSGGRRGVALLFGFRYMIGKIIGRENFVIHDNPKRKVAIFKEKKAPEIEIGSIENQNNDNLKESKENNDVKQKNKKEKEHKKKSESKLATGFKKLFFRADVTGKVLNDTYSDGVIIISVKGAEVQKADVDMKDLRKLERNLSTKKSNNDLKKDLKNIEWKSGVAPTAEELQTKQEEKEVMKEIQNIAWQTGLSKEDETSNNAVVQTPTRDFGICSVNKNPKRINKTYINPNEVRKANTISDFSDFELEEIDNKI
jgi:predicted outer membrane repeat protein